MATNVFPSASRLQLIQQEYVANAMLDDPILKHIPLVTTSDCYLEWEQKDNYRGLQLARGLNGEPSRVSQTGAKRFRVEPGVYGEFDVIDENVITVKRQLGTYADHVDLRTETEEKAEKLAVRQAVRIRQIIWGLLTTGTLNVLGPSGQAVYADAYTFQTHDSNPDIDSVSTAVPLADFRTIQLKGAGNGAVFNSKAVAFMRRLDANMILANSNAADLGGRLVNSGSTVNNIGDVNRFLLADDLPQIEVMDDGYFDEAGNFNYYIPAGTAVVVGARQTGETLGEYRMTRNANNQGAAGGPYAKVIDKTKDHVPPSVEVHAGHNGGVVIYYPSAICLWTLYT